MDPKLGYNKPEDVRELRSQGVLIVTLGSEEEVARLFNEVANYLVPNPLAFNKVKKCCIKLNQSRRSRKATTGQPATSCDRPAAAAAASRLHTIGRQPPSHLKVELSCFEFVYK